MARRLYESGIVQAVDDGILQGLALVPFVPLLQPFFVFGEPTYLPPTFFLEPFSDEEQSNGG